MNFSRSKEQEHKNNTLKGYCSGILQVIKRAIYHLCETLATVYTWVRSLCSILAVMVPHSKRVMGLMHECVSGNKTIMKPLTVKRHACYFAQFKVNVALLALG